MSNRNYISAYMELMVEQRRYGQSLPIQAEYFRDAYPIPKGFASHEEVFLSMAPGAAFGSWTVEYRKGGDYYDLQLNHIGPHRVFVSPDQRHKYYQDRAGFWHRKESA